MHAILIIGAGRSATALIDYVLEQAAQHNWTVTVADADLKAAKKKVAGHPNGKAAWLDVQKVNDRRDLIGRADVVVSLLPPHLHLEVAKDCIHLHKHLITASYVSKSLYLLGDEVRQRDLIFMGEMGLDPGIDHMSAMQKIHAIHEQGGQLTAFRSYTGGLVAPESDDNPWHYKISWNPRNVVLAGQGTAQYLQDGKLKYIPYNRIFQSYRPIEVPGLGRYEVYPNRDSLLYREAYGLEGIPNILRGTIRAPGFCDAWDALVRIGLTDNSYPIVDSENLTYHELIEAYLSPEIKSGSVRDRVAQFLGEETSSEIMHKLDWLGLFRKKKIGLPSATPAVILEDLLLKKWKLRPDEKDMVIMQHEFEYELEGERQLLVSSMILKGDDAIHTAMSKLVGLPIGIFVKLVMLGEIRSTGLQIPVRKEVYQPVLTELRNYGVEFVETSPQPS